MRAANYAPSVIRKPEVLTKSKGFKELLTACGLTEDLIASSLVDDIKAKPHRRVRELELGADILKMRGTEDPAGTNNVIIVNITQEGANKYGIKQNGEIFPGPVTDIQ